MVEIDKRIWSIDKLYQNIFNSKQYSKMLVIVGPSGSGKSTCAEFIESRYNYKAINLYTTREKRKKTTEKNVFSLSKKEFEEKLHINYFFLSRVGIEPFYGYSKRDLEKILNLNKSPILMFRNHGIEFLSDVIYNMEVIFITGDAKKIVSQSHSITPKFSESEVKKILDNNLKLKNKLDYKGIKNYTINNNYDENFFESISKLELFGEEYV